MFCNDLTSRMLRRISDILPFPQPVRRSDKLTNFLYLTIENFGSDSFYRLPVSVHYNDTYIDLRVALSVQEELLERAVLLCRFCFPSRPVLLRCATGFTTWREE